MKLVNVGNALKVTCVGFAAGVLLRVVQMLYFFDYDTGFYTDGGVMAWISLALPLATGLLASWMCFRSRRYFGPYVPRKNVMAGVTAVLSGAVLLLSGALQWMDLRLQLAAGGEYVALHGLFLGCCLLFGLVQLCLSVGFFTGKNSLEKARLLYLVGVLWGVAYLILVYVFYAKSSSFVENFFAVLGGVATLLCLFYLCKLFAGVDEEGAAKRPLWPASSPWCWGLPTPSPTWRCCAGPHLHRGDAPGGAAGQHGGAAVFAGVSGVLSQVQPAAHPQGRHRAPRGPAQRQAL